MALPDDSVNGLTHLFVYGTLRDPGLVARLTGKQFRSLSATLPGFRRIEAPGYHPYVQPDPEATVEGSLLLDVDASSLSRIDEYEAEGTLYRRVTVDVTTDGRRHQAATYVGLRPAAVAHDS